MKNDNQTVCESKQKKAYQKPVLLSEGLYTANMSSCGKLVNNVNSVCGH